MEPTFFATPAKWRAWLHKNHAKQTELLVGFWKRDSGKPSITWPESVDQALCYGWIDGVRKSLSDEAYTIRFTPRKPTSNWSAVNMRRMAELEKLGLVQAAGRKAFAARQESKSAIYAYEQDRKTATLTGDDLKRLKANKKAWAWFQQYPAWYRHLAAFRVNSAKKPETRARRLDTLIDHCVNQRTVNELRLMDAPGSK